MRYKYTVDEIDKLRSACFQRYHFGSTVPVNGRMGRVCSEGEADKGIEEMVRTYMVAGLKAEDIYKADRGLK